LLLLAYSPVVTAGLLCVGDEPVDSCCKPGEDKLASQLLDGSDCGCCVAVATAPSSAGVTHDVPLDLESALDSPRQARASAVPATPDEVPRTPLASLRAVVLLI
jgi:hypothetical protein